MKPKTVYLIDDDTEDLQFMRDILHRVDPSVKCVTFEYPEEAMKVLTSDLAVLPDYIFIDINMPKMKGGDCLRFLRKDSRFLETPIILYSTSMPADIARELLAAGADFTFAKPNRESEYFTILQSVLFGDVIQKRRQSSSK